MDKENVYIEDIMILKYSLLQLKNTQMKLDPEEKTAFKEKLKNACIQLVEQRINTAKMAMDAAQESANGEGKSSAGDKYETSRAMGQLDRDMNAKQFAEAQRELEFIKSININIQNSVLIGAVAVCSNFTFFVAAGLGTVIIDDVKVVTLSPGAPIAKVLMNKKAGDKCGFNGNEIVVVDVF